MAIMSDFNIDTLAFSFSNQVNQFIDEIKSLNFLPVINIPTRITESSATCIDHVYINQLTPCKYIWGTKCAHTKCASRVIFMSMIIYQ